MKDLEERVQKDAIVNEGNEVDVDSIFSQYVDVNLLDEMANEWAFRFRNLKLTKIVTIESSGIALATLLAIKLNVPVVIVKKTPEFEVDDAYTARIYSHQYHQSITAYIMKQNLCRDDKVVIIDDFLANGWAAEGMISMIEESGAKVVAMGVAVEKAQKAGGQKIRAKGIQLESLSVITGVDESGKISFAE
ncbi:MAG: xanthine phosphoribosyltransferase [Acholeplasmatales bacterium]|nr:xanthine phosphoribosyltransferase [Acholeplasmatales bacterium]